MPKHLNAIDVLIVNYLSDDDTRAAVAAVSGPGVTVRVWDNSGGLLADPRGLDVHGAGTNDFYAHGNNELWAMGNAPHVLLLNPDVRLTHADLLTLSRRLSATPGAWGIAPLLVDAAGNPQDYLRALPTNRALIADRFPPARKLFSGSYSTYRQTHVDPRHATTVEQPAAGCLLLDRFTVGAKVFDETFRLFFNDVDLARRMTAAGWNAVLASDITATHGGGSSLRAARAKGEPIVAEYDTALLTYARQHLGSGVGIRSAVAARRLAVRLTGRDGWEQAA